jgi:hypothetical protein
MEKGRFILIIFKKVRKEAVNSDLLTDSAIHLTRLPYSGNVRQKSIAVCSCSRHAFFTIFKATLMAAELHSL